MPTRLYFYESTYSGTAPGLSNGPVAPITESTNSNIPRNMGLALPVQSIHADASAVALRQTSIQTIRYRQFISPPLSAGFTLNAAGDGTNAYRINIAGSVSNTNMNSGPNRAWINILRDGVFVAKVRIFSPNIINPSVTNSFQVLSQSTNSSSFDHDLGSTFAVLAGDRIVVEIGSQFVQGMSATYTGAIAYDGGVVTETLDAIVTNHASFIEFTQNFTFGSAPLPPASIGTATGTVVSTASGVLATPANNIGAASGASASTATATLGNAPPYPGDLGRVTLLGNSQTTAELFTVPKFRISIDNRWDMTGTTVLLAGYAQGFALGSPTASNTVKRLSADGTEADYSANRLRSVVQVGSAIGWVSDASYAGVVQSPYTAWFSSPGTGTTNLPGDTGIATTWSSITHTGTEYWAWAAQGPSETNEQFAVSTDGVTWTQPASMPTRAPRTLESVSHIGLSMANGLLFRTSTGVITHRNALNNWVEATGTVTNTAIVFGNTNQWGKVVFQNGFYFSVSTGSTSVIRSTDAITWEKVPNFPSFAVRELAVCGGYLIAVSSTGAARITYTKDGGTTWATHDLGWTGNTSMRIFAVPGSTSKFLVGGPNGSSSRALVLDIRDFNAALDFFGYGLSLSKAQGQLRDEVASPNLGIATAVVGSTHSADLTTAKGTRLFMDGPRLVVSTATATLTDGPTQWIGVSKARVSLQGAGVSLTRLAGTTTNKAFVTSTGRWLSLRRTGGTEGNPIFRLFSSDNEGRSWQDRSASSASGTAQLHVTQGASGRLLFSTTFGTAAYYSDNNGTTWTACGLPALTAASSSIVYGAGPARYVRVGKDISGGGNPVFDDRFESSTDGVAWTRGHVLTDSVVPSLRSGLVLDVQQNIWWSAELNRFVAIGIVGYPDYPSPTSVVYNSTDGLTWTRVNDSTIPGQIGATYLPFEMVGGVITNGTHYSTDGGAVWQAVQQPPGPNVNRTLFIARGRFMMLAENSAYSSTDGNIWTPLLFEGSYFSGAGIGPTTGQQYIHIIGRPLTDTSPVVIAAETLTGKDALMVSGSAQLTATGLQAAQLVAVGQSRVGVSAFLGDQQTPLLAATALCVSTAVNAATVLIDTVVFLQTLRSVSTVAPATLVTAIRMASTLRTRARSTGGGVVETPAFFSLRNTVYLPSTGLVASTTQRRNPLTGVWGPLTPPDGTNAPAVIASNGTNTLCAFSTTGPLTYSSTNGLTWVAGSTIPQPPGGWSGKVEFGITGSAGKFLLFARSGGSFYFWVSTDGRAWSSATTVTTPDDGGATSQLRVFPHLDGFVAGYTANGRPWQIAYSADGVSWRFRSVSVPGGIYLGAPQGYSGGMMCVTGLSNNATHFVDLQQILHGGTVQIVSFPADDNNVPASFWQGDIYSTRPVFYSARANGFDTLTDPVTQGRHIYAATRWAKPATLTLTGDYEVFDGALFARVTRTADAVEVGAEANWGPSLFSSSILMTGAAATQATASGAFVSPAAELVGVLSGVAAASATLTTRQSVAGSLTGLATASATLTTGVRFQAAQQALVTASASLTTGVRFAASAQATATRSATLTTQIRLNASPAVLASATATLAAAGASFVGSAAGSAQASALLTAFARVQAVGSAQATATGQLSTGIRVAASGAGSSSAAATLTVGVRFTAAGQSSSTVSAGLTTSIRMSGSAPSAAAATATILTGINLSAQLVVEALSGSSLGTGINLQAAVQAAVTARAAVREALSAGSRRNSLVYTSTPTQMVKLQNVSSLTATTLSDSAAVLTRPLSVTITR